MVSVNATSILSTLITANHVLHYHSEPRECLHILFCQNLSASAHLIYQHINELNVADASQTDPTRPRSFFERFIHSEIYKRFEDVNSVLHSHSPEVLPYTITDVPLKAVYHMPGFLGDHGVPNFDIAEFYEPGDQQDLLVSNPRLGAAPSQHLQCQLKNKFVPRSPALL
ncbi:hypothetical protein GJ744_002478 [Endocarpon pusillum]|uniref:Class II aldolase/adducin N-terminal domain-containing protein n=1 Tax=Endocarpon pusillum TaxID=364733 RepID=A0A8H7AB62_9EURO|nr:hypothetical protein GJ744_002478 [Endocarpon pusillum]